MEIAWTCPDCQAAGRTDFVAVTWPRCAACGHSFDWSDVLPSARYAAALEILDRQQATVEGELAARRRVQALIAACVIVAAIVLVWIV